MDWVTATKHFTLIVETGSFAEAARRRYTSSSALSKQISWLEDHLKTKLLYRTTRHISLTESGKSYYEEAKKILDEIDCLTHNIHEASDTLRGTLRVSFQAISQQTQLLKIIPDFLDKNPGIEIELIEHPRQGDLAAEGIDVAIVRGYGLNSNLVQGRLGDVLVQVFGAPEYFEKNGIPQTPSDLANHNCLIHTELDQQARWKFKDKQYINVKGNFRANSPGLIIESAKNGLGLIQISDSLIACYVEDGLLVPVLRDYSEPCADIYALYPKTPCPDRNVATFISFMTEQKLCSLYCRSEQVITETKIPMLQKAAYSL